MRFGRVYSREIVASDLDAVARLLTKAFGYSHEYFPELLYTLTQHSTPVGFPKYGYILLSDDVIVGAILMIFSAIGSGAVRSIRCHVTSWSVDPPYRHFAALFFSKALSHEHVTYLNLLAIRRSLPFLELQGFSKCSDGQFVAIPVLSRGCGEGHLQVIPADPISYANVDPFEQELLIAHGKYGCISLWCVTRDSAHPFVFQPRRLKGLIPYVQLIYCRDVKELVRFARPIGLFLALRGRFFVAANSNGRVPGLMGKYFPGVLPLYCKGGGMPQVGDLAYTQFSMHLRPQTTMTTRLSKYWTRIGSLLVQLDQARRYFKWVNWPGRHRR